MENQVNVDEVLAGLRDTIGNLAQENAILKARIKSLLEQERTSE